VNLEKLKSNVGWRVQLGPPAIHLDEFGRELQGKNEDWIIQSVTDDEIRIDEAAMLSLTTKLGKDHVHSFATNPARSIPNGIQYGLLKLHIQLYIPPNAPVWIQTCVRPGERLPPPPVKITELFVGLNFPTESGIRQKLEAQGFELGWARASRVPTLELQGGEIVIDKDRHGHLIRFAVRDPAESLILVKKRRK
jgi:hypothetical protein